MKRKRIFSRLLFLMLAIMITVTLYQPTQAASGKYTGTYTKHGLFQVICQSPSSQAIPSL